MSSFGRWMRDLNGAYPVFPGTLVSYSVQLLSARLPVQILTERDPSVSAGDVHANKTKGLVATQKLLGYGRSRPLATGAPRKFSPLLG